MDKNYLQAAGRLLKVNKNSMNQHKSARNSAILAHFLPLFFRLLLFIINYLHAKKDEQVENGTPGGGVHSNFKCNRFETVGLLNEVGGFFGLISPICHCAPVAGNYMQTIGGSRLS